MEQSQSSSAVEFERRLSDGLSVAGQTGTAAAVLARLHGRSPRQMLRDRAASTVRRSSVLAALVLGVLSGVLLINGRSGGPGAVGVPVMESSPQDPVIVLLEEDVTPDQTTPTTVLASLLLGE